MSVSLPTKTQKVGGDLFFLPGYDANTSLIPTLTASNTVTETANIEALSREPFAIVSEFNYSTEFQDDETIEAINCGQETFLVTGKKVATVGGTILQNNDLASLQYVLGGDIVNNVISVTQEEEYFLQGLGQQTKPKCAFRFRSCVYIDKEDTVLPYRRDYIYVADATLDGAIEDAYRVGSETFTGVDFSLISESKTFQKVIKKGATELDV